MLRWEDSSDGSQSLATLQLKSWFLTLPWLLKCWARVAACNKQCERSLSASLLKTSTFSLLPSRLGFVNPDGQKWASKFLWMHEVAHGVALVSCGLPPCFYSGNREDLPCSILYFFWSLISQVGPFTIFYDLGQLRVLRSVSCGLGDLRLCSFIKQRRLRAGNSPWSSGAQVTTFGLDYTGPKTSMEMGNVVVFHGEKQ